MKQRNRIARRRAHRIQASLLALTWILVGCSDDSPEKSTCNASFLEADLDATPFMGPGADERGQLKLEPGHRYIVSTTYGVPNPGADGTPVPDSYIQAFGAIQEQLAKQQGLVAYQLSSSDTCGSGRTLAVWDSQDAMYEFVTSPAHFSAMTNVHALLKPGYAVTHYDASEANEMTFAVAVRHVADEPQR